MKQTFTSAFDSCDPQSHSYYRCPSIGITSGIILYKSGVLNISKISNGLIFGLLAGSAVFIVFLANWQMFTLIECKLARYDWEGIDRNAKRFIRSTLIQILNKSLNS